jgi:hypothetical protein
MKSKSPFSPCCSEASKIWDLTRLFSDLGNIKRKYLKQGRGLSEVEKDCLCLLLCRRTLKDIAPAIGWQYNSLTSSIRKMLYVHIEELTGEEIRKPDDVSFRLSAYKLNNIEQQEITLNLSLTLDKNDPEQIKKIIDFLQKLLGDKFQT